MPDLFDNPPQPASNRLIRPLEDLLNQVPEGWRAVTEAWRASAEGQRLLRFVAERQAAGAVVYPATPFKALELTPLTSVRVVVLGQDPYHGPGQAEGLAFSVPRGVKLPPSLRNIFAELARDPAAARCGVQGHPEAGPAPQSSRVGTMPTAGQGHLGRWAAQGVLLLNTSLTVEDGQPASHAKRGWEALTDALIAAVAGLPQPVVFMLWGAYAQAKAALIEAAAPGRHLCLRANHPSPLSARRGPLPFIGCGHFGNAQVRALDIDWRV